MKESWNRRQVLKQLAATSAAAVLPRRSVAKILLEEPTPEREIQITSVSENTVRLSVLPVREDKTVAIPLNGSLAHTSWGAPTQKLQRDSQAREFQAGNLQVHVSQTPLVFTISTLNDRQIQRLKIEAGSSVVSFATGNSPLLGLGEGGPQFDRRGSRDSMGSGQGAYRLATHGGRVPIPWIISTEGWALFIHQPFGTFDFTGPQSTFRPSNAGTALD
ncbi:MAG: glycoside hydrolase, partial [Acidobacteria bacterium]